MKRVFVAQNPTEAHLVKDLLEQQSITAIVRHDELFGALGAIPIGSDTLPSVWITDDLQLSEALEFIAEYQQGVLGTTEDSD